MRQLKNYMEEIVDQYLSRMIPEYAACKCDICYMDMKALSLNSLPAKYVVTEIGALFAQTDDIDFQNKANIIAAVTKAIETVKARPRH